MARQTGKDSLAEKIAHADWRCRHWLAEDTDAKQKGNTRRAEMCQRKAQFWLDRYNKLQGAG